jgi:hypothetical protein
VYYSSFGGKYIVRFLAAGQGLSAAFTAHPAGVVVEEWQAIAGPLSIGFGGRSNFLHLRSCAIN